MRGRAKTSGLQLVTRCGVVLAIALLSMIWQTESVAAFPPWKSSSSEGNRKSQAEADPAATRAVQAVSTQSTGVDGQTSWIIEPDVPRIPKVAGLDTQLPPHIRQRLSYAFDLAQRGATYSAASEFQSVLGLCALELDARAGGTTHRDALRQGLIALDEADEFSGEQVDWRESADVRSLAVSHHTPVLKQDAQRPVDSIQAVQAYYAFAENRLSYACEGMPGASLAFYGLGRTIVVPETRVAHAAGKAALFHRVALVIAPQNVLAGNELGVLLAQHGQLDEAEQMFRQCVAVNGTPETYRNLAAVYAHRGDQHASQAALAAGNALATRDQQAAPATGATPGTTQPQAAEKGAKDSDDQSRHATKFRLDSLIPGVFRR